MIIYGTKTLTSTRGEGTFNCPRCGMGKPYRHQSSDRYFTLYFIPLIALRSAGTYIECGSCGETSRTNRCSITIPKRNERSYSPICGMRILEWCF